MAEVVNSGAQDAPLRCCHSPEQLVKQEGNHGLSEGTAFQEEKKTRAKVLRQVGPGLYKPFKEALLFEGGRGVRGRLIGSCTCPCGLCRHITALPPCVPPPVVPGDASLVADGQTLGSARGWKGKVLCFVDGIWLDLQRLCFLGNVVICYEGHLSVGRKVDTRDLWPGGLVSLPSAL